MNGQRVQIPALFLYMPRKSCLKAPVFGSLRWFKEEAVMKAFIRWVWVLCLFPPRVFGQAKLPITTSDHFVVEAPAVVQPGGETVDFIVGVEGSRFYTAYNMEIALPEDLVFVPNDKGNCAMMCGLEGMYPHDDSMGFPQFTHIFASGLQVNGNLRVACFSSLNEDFTSFSGRLFRVSVKASPYAKPGMGEIRMFGLNLTVAENAQKYIPEGDLNTGEIEVGNHASVPISISAANRYGTCILPFGLEALPAGLEAYTVASVSDGVLKLDPVTALQAYTPYVLYAANGFSGVLEGTVDASLYPEDTRSVTVNGLTGIVTPQEVTEGYILQNQGDGVRFYRVGDVPFALPAGRCYLSASVSAGVNLRMERNATGITDSRTDVTLPDDTCYDLLGRRVERLVPGRVYLSTRRGVFLQSK